jgi:hypothetical protein
MEKNAACPRHSSVTGTPAVGLAIERGRRDESISSLLRSNFKASSFRSTETAMSPLCTSPPPGPRALSTFAVGRRAAMATISAARTRSHEPVAPDLDGQASFARLPHRDVALTWMGNAQIGDIDR